MSGLKVGWDLDGVGFDFVEAIRRAAILYEGDCPKSVAAPATTWDWFLHDWGWSVDKYRRVHSAGLAWGLFEWSDMALPGFVEGLARVRKYGGTNHIVTARGLGENAPAVTAQTMRWLDFQARGLVDSVTFAHDKGPFINSFDSLLDDSPQSFYEMVREGDWQWSNMGPYLLDAAYNRDVDTTGLGLPPRRVHSIAEYLDVLGVPS